MRRAATLGGKYYVSLACDRVSTMTTTTEPRLCTNCGIEIAAQYGRPPKDGNWYCSHPRCRSVRSRNRRRERLYGIPVDKIEDRPCLLCGAKLQSRPWRATDREIGRWCPHKRRCQEHKAAVLGAEGLEDLGARLARMDEIFITLRDRSRAGFVDCPTCGFTFAIPTFAHPFGITSNINGDFRPCFALGSLSPSMELAKATWPDSLSSSPEELDHILSVRRARDEEATRSRAHRDRGHDTETKYGHWDASKKGGR